MFRHKEPRVILSMTIIELVVSVYNEDIEYLNNKPFNQYKTTIYNKNESHLENAINICNIGRCDHTYLYHIIHNYDNLSDVTIFLPGSCLDEHKKNKTLKLIELVEKSKDTVFIGNNIHENELYNFEISDWRATNARNRELNSESILQLCSIRPFGKWYDHNFSGIKLEFVSYVGIFAVSKLHILQRTKEEYMKLIGYLETSNPESGHYMERSWVSVFHPVPGECLFHP